MDDLVAFLRTRLDKDEQVARAVTNDDWGSGDDAERLEWEDLPDTAFRHAKRHDPARALAEVDAKRRIVDAVRLTIDIYAGGTVLDLAYETLRLLALPYADHPDYREEWRP